MIRFASLIAAAAMAGGCHFGGKAETRDAGPIGEEQYAVGAFDRIAVAGPYDVTVAHDGAAGISARGGRDLLAETDVVVEEGVLKIRPKRRQGFRWKGEGRKAAFTIRGAALRGATIAGSGDIRIDRVDGERFDGEVAGSGNLGIAAIATKQAEFSVAGSGNVRAAGKVDALEISIAGSGDVDLAALDSANASVSIAGSGNVRARATRTADVTIMGSGNVDMGGGAKCEVTKAGSGRVHCS